MTGKKEHALRGAFSFLAAAVQLYMAAEYTEVFVTRRRAEALAVAICTTGLAVMEAVKVGRRVEALLGLR